MQTTQREPQPFIGFLMVCGIGLFLMICYALCSPQTPEERAKRNEDDNKVSAYVYAVEFVKKRIVSPSTAVFGEMPQSTVVKTHDDIYRVSGYLDAQNRYGAMVRMVYICDVRVNKDAGELVNIELQDR